MKYCPNCQTNYTDDTLKFCLQDGALLSEVSSPYAASSSNTDMPTVASSSNADMPTVAFDDSPTVVSHKPPPQVVRIDAPEVSRQSLEENWQASLPSAEPPVEQPVIPRIIPRAEPRAEPRTAQRIELPVEPRVQQRVEPRVEPRVVPPMRKSNTSSTVLLTALLTALLVGGGIAGWYFMKNRKTEVASSVNTAPKTNRPLNANAASNQESNANSVVAPPTPSATAVPKPTLKSEDAQNVTTDVGYVIDDWKEASESRDIDRHLNNYADTVDYYRAGRVALAKVRADKQKAFEQFDSIKFNVSNLKITPDASGEKATAVFDKEWTFEGADKHSSGKVQQLLTLNKIQGNWLITGEKDLKVYYTKN